MRRGLMKVLLSSELAYIHGHNFVSNERINKTGGGVDLYLLDKFEFKIRSDLNTSHQSCY